MADLPGGPNWVEGYSKYRPEIVFKALRRRMEKDVEAFNNLPSDVREDRKYVVDSLPNDQRNFSVAYSTEYVDYADPSTRPRVNVQLMDRTIVINGAGQILTVKMYWNYITGRCELDLHRDDEEFTVQLWQISQWSLIPSFFG